MSPRPPKQAHPRKLALFRTAGSATMWPSRPRLGSPPGAGVLRQIGFVSHNHPRSRLCPRCPIPPKFGFVSHDPPQHCLPPALSRLALFRAIAVLKLALFHTEHRGEATGASDEGTAHPAPRPGGPSPTELALFRRLPMLVIEHAPRRAPILHSALRNRRALGP